MISLFAVIAFAAGCALFGAALGWCCGVRREPATAGISETVLDPHSAEVQRKKEFLKRMGPIAKLASRVDTSVEDHLVQMNDITGTFAEVAQDPAVILSSASQLMLANQRLQTELTEAKVEIQRQRAQTQSYRMESLTDPLTSLANRRAFDQEICRQVGRCQRSNHSLSLLAIDIDYFKRVNDKYGHMVGDQMLKSFSSCLTSALRDFDFVARFGGEEFIAILRGRPWTKALKIAERLRTSIADHLFNMRDLEIRITASIGVKEMERHETESELIQKADAALLAAKKGGRNRIYFHDGQKCAPFKVEVESDEVTTGSSDSGLIDAAAEALLLEVLPC